MKRITILVILIVILFTICLYLVSNTETENYENMPEKHYSQFSDSVLLTKKAKEMTHDNKGTAERLLNLGDECKYDADCKSNVCGSGLSNIDRCY